MSSPPPTSTSSLSEKRESLLSFIEDTAGHNVDNDAEIQFAKERDIRQRFRRLVDPGIMRHNERRAVDACLKTLVTLSDNLLREPDNEKYKSFKTTNALIKRTLVDTKGGLEYAIEMGFRSEVQNLQPMYVFHSTPVRLVNLRVGNAILKEAITREEDAADRAARAAKEQKAAAALAAQQVKLDFEDDRARKKLLDQREKEWREGQGTSRPSGNAPSGSSNVASLSSSQPSVRFLNDSPYLVGSGCCGRP